MISNKTSKLIDIKDSVNVMAELTETYNECIGCGKCMKDCSMLNKFCNSPKELMKEIINKGKFHSIMPFSCTGCGYCKEVCPKNIDLAKLFLTLKKYSVYSNSGKPPIKGYNVVNFHQINSFSRLFTSSHIVGNENLNSQNNIKNIINYDNSVKDGQDAKKNIVFIPGCSLTSYNPILAMKVYEFLKDRLPGISIILKCCGKPTISLGQQGKFKGYYGQLQQELEKMNAEEVIVACPSCFKTLKENSPSLNIKTLWEVIDEIGIPEEIKEIGKDTGITFAIHDPCITRYETKTHNSIRNIVYDLGFNIEEFKYSRNKTLCCGAGEMVGVTNNKLAVEQMKKRASQAESDYIVTYCASCVEAMTVGGKSSVHILDLLFNENMYLKLNFKQENQGFIKKWTNRYKCKRMIEKLDA